jgi:hypothetical protein
MSTAVQHINRIKNKAHMSISTDTENVFEKNSTFFHDKNPEETRKIRSMPYHNKGYI